MVKKESQFQITLYLDKGGDNFRQWVGGKCRAHSPTGNIRGGNDQPWSPGSLI